MSFYVNASLDSFENQLNKSSLLWVLPLLPFVKTESRRFLWRLGRWRGSGIACFLSVSNVLFSVLRCLILPAACMNHRNLSLLFLAGAVAPPKETIFGWNVHLVPTTSSRTWKQCSQFQFPCYLQGSLYIFPYVCFILTSVVLLHTMNHSARTKTIHDSRRHKFGRNYIF